MRTRLHGISFNELPHLEDGEVVTITREEGKPWDSDGNPAYSVRLEGLHLGYIPLVTTLMEESKRAKDGFLKVYKQKFREMTADQLREYAAALNANEETECFHEWSFVGKDKARPISHVREKEAGVAHEIRDYLYVDIMCNRQVTMGTLTLAFFDDKEGLNFEGIGDVCSISVFVDMESCGSAGNPLVSKTYVADLTEEAALNDEIDW